MSTAAGLIGDTLGGYAVEALLGSGGMASVYRGRDVHLQRPVAIKVLSGHTAALPGFSDRFRQEARLVANLRHPNIVQIYTFGEERGLIYMVQELLPGPTLEQRIADVNQQGAFFSNDDVTAIMAQLAAALDTAHTTGIIHRDVKPANALWNAAGQLVLTDFGIAKDLGDAVTKTQTGMVMGTPSYMAPEQAQGLPLTPATDNYALGVILYQLLTNQLPFAGTQGMAVLIQHVQDAPPPPRGLRPDLPHAVEAVVLRALAKDPAARYQRPSELVAALQQAWTTAGGATDIHQRATQLWAPVASAPPVAAPAAPAGTAPPQSAPTPQPAPAPQPTGRLLAILGVLLVLAFIGGIGLALRGAADTGDQAAAPTPAAPATPDGPVTEVRNLLETAARDGSAGPQAESFISGIDDAQQALDQGDNAAATVQLTNLQRTLLQEARAGALDPDVLRRALAGIDTIAAEYQLALPLRVRSE